jgi:hypothetical protein
MVSSQLLTVDQIASLEINDQVRIESMLIGEMMKDQRVRDKLSAELKTALPKLSRPTP